MCGLTFIALIVLRTGSAFSNLTLCSQAGRSNCCSCQMDQWMPRSSHLQVCLCSRANILPLAHVPIDYVTVSRCQSRCLHNCQESSAAGFQVVMLFDGHQACLLHSRPHWLRWHARF